MYRQKQGRIVEKIPAIKLQRMNLVDYPGEICAKLTIAGCNFRCSFCNQFNLVIKQHIRSAIPERELLYRLYDYKDTVSAICIGGGEPTLHNGLVLLVYKIKSLGYKIKLDTNGTRHRRINKLIEDNLIDYFTLDLKAPLDRYNEVVDVRADVKSIEQTIKLLRTSSVPHEFRVTMVPGLVEKEDLEKIALMLAGSRKLVIQTFKRSGKMCPEYNGVPPYTIDDLREFKKLVSHYFNECEIRY